MQLSISEMAKQKKTTRLTQITSSTYLLLVLSVWYPSLFVYSTNFREVLSSELLLNLGFGCWLALFSYIFWLACRHAARRKWIPTKVAALWNANHQKIEVVVNTLMASSILLLLLKNNIDQVYFDFIGINSNLARRAYYFAILICFLGITVNFVAKRTASALNASLGFLVIVCCMNVSLGSGRLNDKRLPEQRKRSETSKAPIPVFNKKPNVFCFILESYPSDLAFKRIYNFDNSSFTHELSQLHFETQQSFHSNAASTYPSYVDLLSMEDEPILRRDLSYQRDVMGGHEYTPVIEIFKENGYEIHTAVPNVGYTNHFRSKISYYDSCFYPNPKPLPFYSHEIPYWAARLCQPYHYVARALFPTLEYQVPYEDLVKSCISTGLGDQPSLCLVKLDVLFHSGHLDLNWNAATKQSLENFSKNFMARVPIANQQLLTLINQILASDNDCVIMLLGDHGAFRYRPLARHPDDYAADPNIAFALRGIDEKSSPTVRDIALDRFSVLYSAHYPAELPHPLDCMPVTTVNVFRHLFAQLSDDADYYHNEKAPDKSYWHDMPGYLRAKMEKHPEDRFIPMADGRALDHWKKQAAREQ